MVRNRETLIAAVVSASKALGQYVEKADLDMIGIDFSVSGDDSIIAELISHAGLSFTCIDVSYEKIPDGISPILLKLDEGWAVKFQDGSVFCYESESERHMFNDELKERYGGRLWIVYLPSLWKEKGKLSEVSDSGWLISLVNKQKGVYAYVFLATALINIFALGIPLFTMAVYDRVIPNNSFSSLIVMAIGVVCVLLFDFFAKNIRSYLIDFAACRLDYSLGVMVFSRLLTLKKSTRKSPSGQLASSIKDYEVLRQFMSSAAITFLGDLPFSLLFISVIWFAGGDMWVWPAIGLVLVVLLSVLILIPLKKLVFETQEDNTEKNILLYESLNGVESLKALGAELWAISRWRKLLGIASATQDCFRRWSTLSQHLASFIQLLVSVAIIVHGSYLVTIGEITTGVLIASMMLGARAMGVSSHIANALISYKQACVSYGVIEKIITAESEVKPVHEIISKHRYDGALELNNVTVKSEKDNVEVLKNISLKIAPGERVGVLGKVGSGKSTILNVLIGLQDVQSGRVLIDDLNINSLDLMELRRQVGFMQQENHLFSGSLRMNISLRNPVLSDDDIIKAMRLAGLDEIIGQTDKGLDLYIAEGGAGLSGGQRQLVCLVRALYADPKVLLLDEPTSFLDNASESRVLKGLEEAVEGKTVVLVTHRPKLLELVDRLIVLDDGAIVADGSKDQVLKSLGHK